MVDCIFHRADEGRMVNAIPSGELAAEAGLPLERREWGRYRMMRFPRLRFLAGPSLQGRTGLLRDFGLPGFGLVVRESLEPGTEITIRLPGPPLGDAHLFSGVVRHSSLFAGSWLVGCQLSRQLTDEEVQRLFRSENE
jgi:hypothetical protein